MPDTLAKSLFEGIGRSVVDPRCDECDRPLSTPKIGEIGLPRLCGLCSKTVELRCDAALKEYAHTTSRKWHRVKLPPAMQRQWDEEHGGSHAD